MEISQIEVSVDEVKERLSVLDTTKACGPDKIPARLLKECSEQIASSLCSLFIHSLHDNVGYLGVSRCPYFIRAKAGSSLLVEALDYVV